MLSVRFSRGAAKFLKRLEPATRDRIVDCVKQLASTPCRGPRKSKGVRIPTAFASASAAFCTRSILCEGVLDVIRLHKRERAYSG